jgi:hypothetical protein
MQLVTTVTFCLCFMAACSQPFNPKGYAFSCNPANGETMLPYPVNTNATASFVGQIVDDTFYYTINIENIQGLTHAHFHLGNATEWPSSILGLFGPLWAIPPMNTSSEAAALTASLRASKPTLLPSLNPTFNGTGTFSGWLTPDTFATTMYGATMDDILTLIQSNNVFLLIHTVENPIGELRCNIPPGTYVDGRVQGLEYVPVPNDVTPPSPSPGCIRLVADLSGEKIVPDPVVTNSTGRFEGWVDGETIQWELTLNDIDQFVFSHIHLGNASAPVPVAAPLWGPIWLVPGLNSTREAQALNDVLMSGWSTNLTDDTATTGEILDAALAAVPQLNPSFNGTKTFTGSLSSDEFAGPLAYFKMKQFLSYAEDSLAYVSHMI